MAHRSCLLRRFSQPPRTCGSSLLFLFLPTLPLPISLTHSSLNVKSPTPPQSKPFPPQQSSTKQAIQLGHHWALTCCCQHNSYYFTLRAPPLRLDGCKLPRLLPRPKGRLDPWAVANRNMRRWSRWAKWTLACLTGPGGPGLTAKMSSTGNRSLHCGSHFFSSSLPRGLSGVRRSAPSNCFPALRFPLGLRHQRREVEGEHLGD